MTTALGIAPDALGNGTDPLQLRKIIQARWANPGIVTGLTCAGRSDLRYQLNAGVAVCQRSTADGCTEAYWQGGTTPSVAVGDASNPRIDVVCIKANDPTQSDPNNQVTAVVVQGTPAVSPVVPTIPAGAVAVATMRMPAGATATNAAIVMAQPDYAIPYGGSLGVLGSFEDLTRYDITSDSQITRSSLKINLPTRRMVEVVYARSMSAESASLKVYISVDGVRQKMSVLEANPQWETHEMRALFELDAGEHTISCSDGIKTMPAIIHAFGFQDGETTHFNGLTFDIFDRGVA